MAPLRYTAKFDPFLSLDCGAPALALELCAIQGNEGIKFCHLATLLIGLAFVGCDSTLAVISLCAALALSAGKYAGTTQGYMQLAHGRATK